MGLHSLREPADPERCHREIDLARACSTRTSPQRVAAEPSTRFGDFAILLERSFLAAYEPPLDFEVALYASSLGDYKRLVSTLS